MPKILTYGNGIDIGAYQFPDRKRPCLCIRKGSSIVIYGTFNNAESADKFMNELADFVGAKEDRIL
jgi:hypothetical protein